MAVYSHSRLACFEKCPRQFHYRYVERRPVETESVEAFVGKRVHEVLERLYDFVGRGHVPSLARVLARFRSDWEAQWQQGRIRIVRSETPEAGWREMGERCLSNHYRRHYPFDGEETLGVEAHVSFALDTEGRYRFQGFVDRVARGRDGALEIHDYKTGRFVPRQEALDEDRQLALYQIGLAGRHGDDAPVRLVWHYLLRDQVRVSSRTPEQLDALRSRTIELIDRIEAEQAFEPRPSSLCTWCEFNDVCPAGLAPQTEGTASAPPPPAPPPIAAAEDSRPAPSPAPPRAPAARRREPVGLEPSRPASPPAPAAQLALFGG